MGRLVNASVIAGLLGATGALSFAAYLKSEGQLARSLNEVWVCGAVAGAAGLLVGLALGDGGYKMPEPDWKVLAATTPAPGEPLRESIQLPVVAHQRRWLHLGAVLLVLGSGVLAAVLGEPIPFLVGAGGAILVVALGTRIEAALVIDPKAGVLRRCVAIGSWLQDPPIGRLEQIRGVTVQSRLHSDRQTSWREYRVCLILEGKRDRLIDATVPVRKIYPVRRAAARLAGQLDVALFEPSPESSVRLRRSPERGLQVLQVQGMESLVTVAVLAVVAIVVTAVWLGLAYYVFFDR